MEKENQINSPDGQLEKTGVISEKLKKDGITNETLGSDHIGVEIIAVQPNNLYKAVSTLKSYGFNYLQCQGGYDEGPGKKLVSFYHFISLWIITKNQLNFKKSD